MLTQGQLQAMINEAVCKSKGSEESVPVTIDTNNLHEAVGNWNSTVMDSISRMTIVQMVIMVVVLGGTVPTTRAKRFGNIVRPRMSDIKKQLIGLVEGILGGTAASLFSPLSARARLSICYAIVFRPPPRSVTSPQTHQH